MANANRSPCDGTYLESRLNTQPRERSLPEVMTDEQRCFAAEHHNLIYRFLHERGWAVSEYYDIAAFGFLRAVRRYLSVPGLDEYAFSSIAWPAMSQSIASFLRAEARRRDAEQRYVNEVTGSPKDPFAELEAKLLLHELASVSSPKQYELAQMRLQGYTIAEIALEQGMTQIRIRRLLKELYSTYLQLYCGMEETEVKK